MRFDEFSARGEVRNLTFRDLTIDAGNDYLTDLCNDAPVTIRMERCTFVGPFSSVYDANRAATYMLDSCRFVGVTVPLESPPSGVRFVNCEVEAADDERADPSAWMSAVLDIDEAGATVVDGVAGTLPEGVTGPVVIVFPVGEHTLVAGKSLGSYRGPRIIRGQGKGATILRVGGQPQVSMLVVRDATIHLSHSSIVGSSVPLARLDRVRLVRWDSGAGGSTAFDQRSNRFIVLRDSEVLDGFGRAPGRGTFASLSGGCTLRVERSRIELAGSRFFDGSGTLVLVDSVVSGVTADELAAEHVSEHALAAACRVRAVDDVAAPLRPERLVAWGPVARPSHQVVRPAACEAGET